MWTAAGRWGNRRSECTATVNASTTVWLHLHSPELGDSGEPAESSESIRSSDAERVECVERLQRASRSRRSSRTRHLRRLQSVLWGCFLGELKRLEAKTSHSTNCTSFYTFFLIHDHTIILSFFLSRKFSTITDFNYRFNLIILLIRL